MIPLSMPVAILSRLALTARESTSPGVLSAPLTQMSDSTTEVKQAR
jgi:hypothetical protein